MRKHAGLMCSALALWSCATRGTPPPAPEVLTYEELLARATAAREAGDWARAASDLTALEQDRRATLEIFDTAEEARSRYAAQLLEEASALAADGDPERAFRLTYALVHSRWIPIAELERARALVTELQEAVATRWEPELIRFVEANPDESRVLAQTYAHLQVLGGRSPAELLAALGRRPGEAAVRALMTLAKADAEAGLWYAALDRTDLARRWLLDLTAPPDALAPVLDLQARAIAALEERARALQPSAPTAARLLLQRVVASGRPESPELQALVRRTQPRLALDAQGRDCGAEAGRLARAASDTNGDGPLHALPLSVVRCERRLVNDTKRLVQYEYGERRQVQGSTYVPGHMTQTGWQEGQVKAKTPVEVRDINEATVGRRWTIGARTALEARVGPGAFAARVEAEGEAIEVYDQRDGRAPERLPKDFVGEADARAFELAVDRVRAKAAELTLDQLLREAEKRTGDAAEEGHAQALLFARAYLPEEHRLRQRAERTFAERYRRATPPPDRTAAPPKPSLYAPPHELKTPTIAGTRY